jgi:hypothetical protein
MLFVFLFACLLVFACVHCIAGQKLGARLKGDLPGVIRGVQALTMNQLQDFQSTGFMEVAGHVLTTEEVLVSRLFQGDATVHDACASPDGQVVVVLNHVVTEDLQVMVCDSPMYVFFVIYVYCFHIRLCFGHGFTTGFASGAGEPCPRPEACLWTVRAGHSRGVAKGYVFFPLLYFCKRQ